ncbi:TRAM domain protein [uncultured archaeon]|nr:TRAM domain protein [uncultured archaeon]
MEEGYEGESGGNREFGQRRPTRKSFGPIPVKEGDTYDVEIEGIGDKGDGIAKVQGYVIVIPNVKKGDKVKVKVNAVRGRVSFGEVIGQTESKPSEETPEPEADDSDIGDVETEGEQ